MISTGYIRVISNWINDLRKRGSCVCKMLLFLRHEDRDEDHLLKGTSTSYFYAGVISPGRQQMVIQRHKMCDG